MILRIFLPISGTNSFRFKNSTFALLSSITLGGAFSAAIYNSDFAALKIKEAYQLVTKNLKSSSLYEGINQISTTFKSWGNTVLSTKDDFKDWLYRYLGPSGFKSGFLELYNKLLSWLTIVYEWFKDKFIEFIKNIPKMVENWKKLRFTFFKWGTFLGGGGASVLWSMFGSGDNWGRLVDLMGKEDFSGALEKFGELVEKNPNSFQEMGDEGMKEILEKIMEDPKEAKEIAENLLEDQEKQNKDKESKEELETEKIKDAYSNQKGGKPKDTQQALGNMIAAGLKKIVSKGNSFKDNYQIAKEAMEEHIGYLEIESKKTGKSAEVKKEFLDTINESKDTLIRAFARLSARAYEISSNPSEKQLATIFEYLMKEEFTKETIEGEEGDAQLEGIVVKSVN